MSVNAWLKSQRPLAGHALSLAMGLGIGQGLLGIAQAWLLALILNAVIFESAGLDAVTTWLWLLLAVVTLRALATWRGDLAAFAAAARVRSALRADLFVHLQRLGPAYLAGERSGALVETLTRGIDDLEGYYARFLPAMTQAMVLPLAVIIAVAPVDWLAAVVMLSTAPLIPLFMILIGSGAERRNRRQWQSLTRMGAHFLDVIQGLPTLKLFGASRREAEVIAHLSEAYRVSTMRVLRIAFLSSAVLEFFAAVSVAIIAVLVGYRLYGMVLPVPVWIPIPDLTLLQGLFVLMMGPELYAPLRNMGAQYHARMSAVAAAEQITRVLAQPLPAAPARRIRLTTHTPLGLRFEDLSFQYAEGRVALTGLNATIEAGTRAAIVGTSGAGKTTLIHLLLGFLAPTQGRILVNDLPLAEIERQDWHRQLAWVPQQPRLFQGTLADNIALGQPEATPEAIMAAARRARAHDFIAALPRGYQSPVGERGAGLSGGQIQRIALARAFLRDAPLVILDEPTASLDPASERLVQDGIEELAAGRTLITVAHRLATVRRADRILVMDDGRLVEQGGHDRLVADQGLYARLVAAYGAEPLVEVG